jgi:hypothetical protein
VRRQPASRLFYFHRGEAIRIITARIGNEVEAMSDATIAAVAALSIADVSRNLPYHLPCSQYIS